MDVFLDYELLEQLSLSDRSEVWRARSRQDGQAVIVKILNTESPTFQQVARFKRAYALAARCDHPGVAAMLALGLRDGRWTMLQQDIGALGLDTLLARRLDERTLPSQPAIALADFFDMALQLCAALEALHGAGVIHHNIHPGNLVWSAARRQLQLIDLGIASELAQDIPLQPAPLALEGGLPSLPSLSYMAPEQSGRINRPVDYRADYYALGATFYELLTGQAPFRGDDALALVHSQLARTPDWSHPVLAALPARLPAILRRLMEKNAEQRYQSLHGLRRDLEACRDGAAAGPLGFADCNPRFLVAQQLHGREREIEVLLAAFERTLAGSGEVLLLAGYSGIGKSALVAEVQQTLVARHAYFLTGKFDQYRRDLPYSALVQALRELVQQLLGEPERQLRAWSGQLRAALGNSLGVLTELLPELALVVGTAEPAQQLAPEPAQLRLGRALRSLVDVFASADQPLVLFLDDLQWADAPTLRMIELFMREPARGHVLLIGAYRDNEVEAGHPLLALDGRLAQAGVRLSKLSLGPLSEQHVARLLAATLRVPLADCAALTRLCHRKTGGNPFFLNQFLGTIHEAGQLQYQPELDCWGWDMAALEQADYTDNVVDLLLDKIRRLPAPAQLLMQYGAATGNRFRLDALAQLWGQGPAATQQALWPALDAGLIQPLGQDYKYLDPDSADTDVSYRFLHDRVQQAAYALCAPAARPALHLRIGRQMLAGGGAGDEQLFATVDQLNAGLALLELPAERLELAALNLRAGLRARRAAALQASLAHLRCGLGLLPADASLSCPALWLDLQLGAAEAAYLCGQYASAEAIYAELGQHRLTPLQQVRCLTVQAHQYHLQGRLAEAIAILREGLALLDCAVPDGAPALQAAYAAVVAELGQQYGGDASAAMLAAGEMRDPLACATIALMQALWTAAYYAGQQELAALLVVSMTRLSLRHGISDFSPVAFVGYAALLALQSGDMEHAYRFGAQALELARRRPNLLTRTLSALMFGAMTLHWTRHLRHSDALYEEAFGWALESADFVQVGSVTVVRSSERIILGHYLPELLESLRGDLELMRANGQQSMADCCVAGALQPVKCLMGLTRDSASYDDEGFSEAAYLERYGGSRVYLCYYLQGKIRNAYLFDSADAEALAGQLDTVTGMMRGQAKVVEASFYAALIWIRALRRAPRRADRAAVQERIAALQASLAAWLEQGPVNIAPKHWLVQAELARDQGNLTLATGYYQQAIDAAGAAGYVQLQALGNELCGQCWADQAHWRVAAVYLREAQARYQQWGASAKVAQLQACHPRLQGGAREPGAAALPGRANSALDLASIFKAAQALSNEIGLRNVLQRLLAIVCENSGAQVARLLLIEQGQCRLEADMAGDAVTVLQARPLLLDAPSDPQFPLTLLRYVLRSGTEVIEDHLATAPRYAADPYVQREQPKSVLCLPLRQAGRIDGVLYLENNLAPASFTAERLEFLRVLGGQALIFIAHARLYDSLERRVAERTAQLEEANSKLATLSATDGLTGLANRRHFDDVLRSEWTRARRSGQPLAVVMVDVDFFKKFNDCYGHQLGDDCLIRVARALQGGTRRTADLVARYGGEEFAIVLPNTSAEVAGQLAEALRAAVEQLAIAHAPTPAGRVTISVGVASAANTGGVEAEALTGAADAALYQAKHGGRNRVILSHVSFFEPRIP